jgi:hypothetical protein
MTVVAVLVDPPREGLVLPRLAETSPLSDAEATDLYTAMVQDTCRAVALSGGDLLVNYRAEESLPEAHREAEGTAEERIRALVADGLSDLSLDEDDEPRFERQVGETYAGRAGNTVTHLLEEEDATSAAVLDGTAPLLERTHVDSAAMKLRSSSVVLGPAPDGRVHYAGFFDPIDFDGAFSTPAVETLAARGRDAGHDVDFVPMLPVVETGSDLASLVSTIRARVTAERNVPPQTAMFVDDLNLRVISQDGETTVVRD